MSTTKLAGIQIPKLLFVLGKGGVGRTTVATSLALSLASRSKTTLLVQWSLSDVISGIFGKPPCGHTEVEIFPYLHAMNFSAEEAIREYFVDHLGLKLLYSLVIENRHVQRLIHAAPGVQELFFLGRLFWLVNLAQKERGWSYDHVIVDAQATGHGVSLFTIAPTVAGFGMTGPLAAECERVAQMLADPELTGTLVSTLAEELPVEETLEFIPKLAADLGRPPLLAIVNRSIAPFFAPVPSSGVPASGVEQSLEIGSENCPEWLSAYVGSLTQASAVAGAKLIFKDLIKRVRFEQDFRHKLAKIPKVASTPVLSMPDVGIENPNAQGREVVERMSAHFAEIEICKN